MDNTPVKGNLPSNDMWKLIASQSYPTVLKNKIGNWPCLSWSIEDWAKNCEDILFKFRCGSKSNIRQWETQNIYTHAKVKDFVSWLTVKNGVLPENHPLKCFNSDDFWCYSSYNYMGEVFQYVPHMLDILDWSDFGLQNRRGRDSTLWIGSQGSNTPCHQDSYGSNIVAQLSGEKLWILYPPDTTSFLYPTRIPYEESSVFSSVNILHPDLNAFPRFTTTQPYMVILKPGDVLYVPPKWWHYVYCLSTAVSVNTWVEHELDDMWRLEEAVSRFLMTAFINTYEKGDSLWLNPPEELLSSDETSALLEMALDRATSNQIGQCEDSIKGSANSVIENSSVLKPMSFDQFEAEMSHHTNYERLSGSYEQNPLIQTINCFLSYEVVKSVIESLKQNYKK